MSLTEETSRFRDWAARRPGRHGEWECDYPHWPELYAAVEQSLDDETWQVADILYVLARDNECEVVRSLLQARTAVLRELAPIIVEDGEPEARWQLAQTLGELATHWGAANLAVLAEDFDEYVRRRALLAMGLSRHPSAERFARAAWSTGEEYPQLAALQVLSQLQVADLDELLRVAEQSPHSHLAAAAAKLRG